MEMASSQAEVPISKLRGTQDEGGEEGPSRPWSGSQVSHQRLVCHIDHHQESGTEEFTVATFLDGVTHNRIIGTNVFNHRSSTEFTKK